MYGTEVYDKVYFRDDYQEQFEALRSRFRGRVQSAMAARKIDDSPVANATTRIALEELEDGGVRIAGSGDFVEYFNNRYGGRDRLGACRASLAEAAERAEKKATVQVRERAESISHGGAIACRMRTSRSHLVLVNAMFALLLLVSLLLLGASRTMLYRSEEALASAKVESVQLESASTEGMLSDGTRARTDADYLDYAREDSVVSYEVEEESFLDSLKDAFAYLWS